MTENCQFKSALIVCLKVSGNIAKKFFLYFYFTFFTVAEFGWKNILKIPVWTYISFE